MTHLIEEPDFKINNVKEYQKFAARTCPDLEDLETNILHMNMGVVTEMGETIDIYKKNIAYKKSIDYVNLAEELIGDNMWYLVNFARIYELPLPSLEYISHNYIPTVILPNLESKHVVSYIMGLLLEYMQNPFVNYITTITKIYALSQLLQIDFYQALTNNIKKLYVRFPNKFSEEHALNRNLEAERIELENKIK